MILTSYFGKRNLKKSGLEPVAISLTVPKSYHGKRCMALAPTREMINLAQEGRTEEYTKLYTGQVLSWLDPMKMYQELDGSVLLCWEKSDSFCHRNLVATWLEQATGNKVDEL